MPAYNYDRYVRQAVESVFSQSYANVELIVVDDGSSDDTVSILRSLSVDAPLPMEVVQASHGGVCAAMNAGLARCRGELISILHADDAYEDRKVEAQVAAFIADHELVLVHSEYQVIDETGELVDASSTLDRPPARGRALRELIADAVDVRSMTMMYRKDVMDGVGGYDESLPLEDWQSILRLAHAGSIGHVNERLVLRRVHRRSHSVTLYRQREFSLSEIAVDVLRDVIPSDMNPEKVCANAVGNVVRNAIAEGNMGKAFAGFQTGWRAFPGGRWRMTRKIPSGFKSFVWMRYLEGSLPDGMVTFIRRLKRRAGE